MTLRYADATLTRMAVAGQYTVFSIRMNDVYDPDPLLGTGSLSGFTEWSALYQKWRVESVAIDWEFVNLNAQPVSLYIYLGTENVTLPSLAVAIDYSELPYATNTVTVGPVNSGSNRGFIKTQASIGTIYGSEKEYMANEAFVGTGGVSPGSPSAKLNTQFIGYSSGAMTFGIYSRLRYRYYLKFFDRYPAIG